MAFDILHDKRGQSEVRGYMGSLPRASGRRYFPLWTYPSTSTGVMTAQQIVYWWFLVPEASTFTEAGVSIGTAAVGNVVIGLYNTSTTTGEPTTLVDNFGSMSTNSTGELTIDITPTLSVNPGLYCLAVVCDNATAQFHLSTTTVPIVTSIGAGSTVPGTYYTCFTETTTSRALPSSATPVISRRFLNQMISVYLKV
jgi:hypothetical protein